ncbi:MAG: CHASE2 domain-containing protein, partial [Armatimonadota bacterium]|nr:CHASE2 domain-containing protein [Armatimonadota bacterium]
MSAADRLPATSHPNGHSNGHSNDHPTSHLRIAARDFRERRWIHFLLMACLAVVLAVLLHTRRWGVAEILDYTALDRYFEIRKPQDPKDVSQTLAHTKDIMLIETTHTLPRGVFAKLLHQFRLAKVVAFDIMFVNQEAELADDVERMWHQEYIPAWRKETQRLGAGIRQARRTTKVILGQWREEIKQTDRRVPGRYKLDQDWQQPHAMLWDQADYKAHLMAFRGSDGVIRHVELFEPEKKIPALGLAIAAAAEGISPDALSRGLNRISRYGGVLHLGSRRIPVAADWRLLIDYVGDRKCFEENSNRIMYQVALLYPPEKFRNKIIIVGETSMKSKEIDRTPFGLMPSIQIHANVVATLRNPRGPLTY